MVILNHKNFKSETLSEIHSLDEIKLTPSNSTLIFDFDINLCNYCSENSLAFGTKIDAIKEIVFSANLNAKYILIDDKELVIKAQKIADDYMYDSKIILIIENEDELEWCAINGIDGVLFKGG